MHFKLIMLLSAVALNVNAEPVSKFVNAKNSGEYFEMQGATVLTSELIPVEQLKNYPILHELHEIRELQHVLNALSILMS